MRQKLTNIKLPIDYNDSVIRDIVTKQIGVCGDIELYKLSLDSRRKDNIHYTSTLIVDAPFNTSLQPYAEEKKSIKQIISKVKNKIQPIIIGSGPCGMFAALVFAEAGLKPIVFERGKSVDERSVDILKFFTKGELNTESNVQYGEGGAGTFSDGKLNTGITSEFIRVMLNEYVRFGANSDILYNSKPHIGTDVLKMVVKNMREHIISLGGTFYFDSKMEKLNITNGKITSIAVNGSEIKCECLVLACGHSARDTMTMLYELGVDMESKPFAIGARIEHKQELIDTAQYGKLNNKLPKADYKLSHKTADGRGCFTFCMCPGGYVMPAASEYGAVVTNGMSERLRDSGYANSAVLVGVKTTDFDNSVLGGINFQRRYEQLAFNLSADCGEYSAPSIKVTDFIANRKSSDLSSYETTYARGVKNVELDKCLPNFVVENMRTGITEFGRKIKGFDKSGLIIGVETRTSSPVKILRGDDYQSTNVAGLYPCGEGVGYAGGITSSAVDGIKVALKILDLD